MAHESSVSDLASVSVGESGKFGGSAKVMSSWPRVSDEPDEFTASQRYIAMSSNVTELIVNRCVPADSVST